MSELKKRNEKTINRFYEEVLNNKQLEKLEELLHPNFRLTDRQEGQSEYLYARQNAKKETYKTIVKGYLDGFPDLKITIKHMLYEETLVMVQWNARITHEGPFFGLKETGKALDFHGFHSFRMKDGLILDLDFIYDSLSLFLGIGHAVININDKKRTDEYFKVLKNMGLLPR